MYCESFADYAQQFNSLGFKIDTFQINLDWEIIPQAKLTGHSPFLCSTNDYNVAYYFNEHGKEWRNELKYPLLQIYLADRYFHCDVGNIKIGIYNISNKKFDLHTYEDFELDNAIEEGKYIFKNVLSEYNRIIPRK